MNITECVCSFIHEARGRSRAKLQLSLNENSCFHRKTETFGRMKTLNMLDCDNIWFSFVFLQVINKVYEQCSSN